MFAKKLSMQIFNSEVKKRSEIKDTSSETKNESVDDPCKDCKRPYIPVINFSPHHCDCSGNPIWNRWDTWCNYCPHRPPVDFPFVEDLKKFINFISKIFTKKDANLKKIEKGA